MRDEHERSIFTRVYNEHAPTIHVYTIVLPVYDELVMTSDEHSRDTCSPYRQHYSVNTL